MSTVFPSNLCRRRKFLAQKPSVVHFFAQFLVVFLLFRQQGYPHDRFSCKITERIMCVHVNTVTGYCCCWWNIVSLAIIIRDFIFLELSICMKSDIGRVFGRFAFVNWCRKFSFSIILLPYFYMRRILEVFFYSNREKEEAYRYFLWFNLYRTISITKLYRNKYI